MIVLRGVRLPPGGDEGSLAALAAKSLGLPPKEIQSLKIVKKSLDARKKSDIHWVYSLALDLGRRQSALCRGIKGKNPEEYQPPEYRIPRVSSPNRPVIAGFGPAGIFAALCLAEAGLRPLVLERGGGAEERAQAVERFWQGGTLDPDCNVQFGEGGAGLFSDGKLNTGIGDSRIPWVLEQFHRFGAPERVCYDARPHIGTDVLSTVVRNMRDHITALGGEVRIRTKLAGLEREDGRLSGIWAQDSGGTSLLPCQDLVLAIGHSARDTLVMLHGLGVPMERKAFSMGVRIEHPQSLVSYSQFGEAARLLPPAEYRLSCRLPDGNSAYTFCMCPGGYVVAASSETGGVVTNGMSLSGRNGENANSALLVTLLPEDFPGSGVLAGMRWQRKLEQAAFAAGGGDYRAPAQTLGDFLSGRTSNGPAGVAPSYRPGVVWGDLHQVLPEKIARTLAEAVPLLARRLTCFDLPGAVLTGPETRSSSPVRILRGADLRSSWGGFYPCGEGAGYAGGITSAAVDGLKCAEKIIESCQNSGY